MKLTTHIIQIPNDVCKPFDNSPNSYSIKVSTPGEISYPISIQTAARNPINLNASDEITSNTSRKNPRAQSSSLARAFNVPLRLYSPAHQTRAGDARSALSTKKERETKTIASLSRAALTRPV